ncbi:hypothetical protein CBM2606_A140250 [Cupriavidus taiwanensis]|nr:hypothetical protein CBM2606_A140250 [Cupriavidus taiwanensis]
MRCKLSRHKFRHEHLLNTSIRANSLTHEAPNDVRGRNFAFDYQLHSDGTIDELWRHPGASDVHPPCAYFLCH